MPALPCEISTLLIITFFLATNVCNNVATTAIIAAGRDYDGDYDDNDASDDNDDDDGDDDDHHQHPSEPQQLS